jgi:plastocyanin
VTRPLLPAALAAALLALVAPAAAQHPSAGDHAGAGAATSEVSIGFDRVAPPELAVVTGDTVMWTNDSARVHTVTADDDAFDSGRLASTETFRHSFAAAGEVAYHCSLHPFIRGVVAVHDLLLEAPPTAASAKRPFVLKGRASSALPPGTPVALEADGGTGFAPIATATLTADGTFSASFVPAATANYRAVAGSLTSPPVELVVLDRSIALSARRVGGAMVLRTTVAPAARGGHVALQFFLPERFGWWPVRRARLDAGSSASFTLRTRRRLRARVVFTLPDGATRLAVSRTVRVGPRR